jgi:hypothetical protein
MNQCKIIEQECEEKKELHEMGIEGTDEEYNSDTCTHTSDEEFIDDESDGKDDLMYIKVAHEIGRKLKPGHFSAPVSRPAITTTYKNTTKHGRHSANKTPKRNHTVGATAPTQALCASSGKHKVAKSKRKPTRFF